jgi:methyl-accepting chemotaxis protein
VVSAGRVVGGNPDSRYRAFLLTVAGIFFYVSNRATQNVIDSSVLTANATLAQYQALRQYYTENVVNKAVREGAMKASYQHGKVRNTIPLPVPNRV